MSQLPALQQHYLIFLAPSYKDTSNGLGYWIADMYCAVSRIKELLPQVLSLLSSAKLCAGPSIQSLPNTFGFKPEITIYISY